MSLFVGLRGTAEELDIKAQNIWAFTGLVWAVLHVMAPYGMSGCHTQRRMGARGRAHPSFGMLPTF